MSSTVSITAISTEGASAIDAGPLWVQLQGELCVLRHACEILSLALPAMPHGMRQESSRLLGSVDTIAGSKYPPEDRSLLHKAKTLLRDVAEEFDNLAVLAAENASGNSAPLVHRASGLGSDGVRTSSAPTPVAMSHLCINMANTKVQASPPCAHHFLDAT
jgi:hypothetical protein